MRMKMIALLLTAAGTALAAPLTAQTATQAATEQSVTSNLTPAGPFAKSPATTEAAVRAVSESATTSSTTNSTTAKAEAAKATTVEPVSMRGVPHGKSPALMIVGAAAIVVGALIDGDGGNILMLGGAVVGLYGLYLYLR